MKSSMYIWNTPTMSDLCRTPSMQTTLWSVCQASGVTILLCDFTDAFVYVDHSLISSFIQAAHTHGILVYDIPSVFATDLTTPTNSQTQKVALLEYNHSYPNAKFDGISFDVESSGQGITAINNYLSYVRTIKSFTNSFGETIVSQNLITNAILDPPYYLAGTPYGNSAGVAAATTLYKEFKEINLNVYDTTLALMTSTLQDGPQICNNNGIKFYIGYETSTNPSYYGAIGTYGKDYFLKLAASVDAQYSGYANYGGRFIEDYMTFGGWWPAGGIGFIIGSSHTATIPATVIPSGIAYTVELWLGPNVNTKSSTTGKIPVTSTGSVQNVAVPIIMPTGGTYHVYIDLYYGTTVLAALVSTSVIVVSGTISEPIIT